MPPLLVAFIAQYQGANGVGDTPQNDGQCVGIVELWLDMLSQPHIWGNACDLGTYAASYPNNYVVIQNGPTNFPVPGDIIVLPAGWGGSSVGHCGIVTAADPNTFTMFEQNDRIGGGDGRCRLWHFSQYYAGMSWIHLKVLDPAPTPPTPPTRPVVVDPPVAPPVVETPVAADPVSVTVPIVATGTGQPVNTPLPVNSTQPEYVETYVAFPEGPRILILMDDAVAIDMTAQNAPKSFVVGTRLKLAGTFTNESKDYYRGTSGDWYGIAQASFIATWVKTAAPTPTQQQPSFFKVFIQDPLGALIRLIARLRK